MGENIQRNLREEVSTFYTNIFESLEQSAGSYNELLEKWLELHSFYLETTAACLAQWVEDHDSQLGQAELLDKIEADAVVVEIVDKNTGKVFRRSLPIQYLETDNGVMLAGETMSGTPSQIAFYSETAVSRMHDIMGKGPDTHRCDEG